MGERVLRRCEAQKSCTCENTYAQLVRLQNFFKLERLSGQKSRAALERCENSVSLRSLFSVKAILNPFKVFRREEGEQNGVDLSALLNCPVGKKALERILGLAAA